ncbi:hypothetical protein [Oceanobacillus sp. FSL W7-1309]|uniref:hypothetical protein n=1 Tax=Oceanobacillus sp. FSL W7-1309 TaxID=2954539 RepID=UPI0030F526B3
MTDFARPLVPKGPGQLANSILVFEEIGPNHYELTVEPLTRLSHYQSISSLVEQNKGAKGRYYGKL